MKSINFCSLCAAPIAYLIPENDNKKRAVCTKCKHIHYENPKIVNACIIEHQDQILLAKRTIQPRAGFWNVPAGFMENGESTRSGAVREIREEVCAELKHIHLFGVYNVIQRNQVHIYFRAQLKNDYYAAGSETSEVKLFHPDHIPWNLLAFPVGVTALKRYCQQIHNRTFTVEEQDILIDYSQYDDLRP